MLDFNSRLWHPAATVSSLAVLSPGAQVMVGGVVQAGGGIGEDTIINTGVLLDHDYEIGKHCHLAPGAVLFGSVQVGNDCHIDAAACVIQGVNIGTGALIAAGAVVVGDVPAGALMSGYQPD